MTEIMSINEIKEYLPHRYPFLLVDRVIDVEPNESIVGIKNVTVNEPFFNGHFPLKPVMPGVLIVEALAQVSGILIYKTLGRKPAFEDLFYLAGVDNARFKRIVQPGDQLRLEVSIVKVKRQLWKFHGEAKVDGVLACEVDFMNIKGDVHD